MNNNLPHREWSSAPTTPRYPGPVTVRSMLPPGHATAFRHDLYRGQQRSSGAPAGQLEDATALSPPLGHINGLLNFLSPLSQRYLPQPVSSSLPPSFDAGELHDQVFSSDELQMQETEVQDAPKRKKRRGGRRGRMSANLLASSTPLALPTAEDRGQAWYDVPIRHGEASGDHADTPYGFLNQQGDAVADGVRVERDRLPGAGSGPGHIARNAHPAGQVVAMRHHRTLPFQGQPGWMPMKYVTPTGWNPSVAMALASAHPPEPNFHPMVHYRAPAIFARPPVAQNMGQTGPRSPPTGSASAVPSAAPDPVATRPTHHEPDEETDRRFEMAERKRALFLRVVDDFPDQKQHLLNMSVMRCGGLDAQLSSNPVHIFVDWSNIQIGFHHALKEKRGFHPKMRTSPTPLSFHAFTFILERYRDVKRRILAGSGLPSPELDEARICGYEVSMLERVMKAREIRPRGHSNGNGNGNGHAYHPTAVSSGTELLLTRQRMVEQGVDELLHMKMLESVLDGIDGIDGGMPSTMVLASGDAAEAEYSAGFLKVVERALKNGWLVELVSFKANLSHAYLRHDFQRRWGHRLTIITLDDYAELLIDVTRSA